MIGLINTMEQLGWASLVGCLSEEEGLSLSQECEKAGQNGKFRRAGVGRGESLAVHEDIRRDHILWLTPDEASKEQRLYLDKLEGLRLALNRRFFLGLFEFEGHYAIYPEGAFYKAHLDRHSGTSDRVVTVILYLNHQWQPGDGGELKLWTTTGDRQGEFVLIEPSMGTLVCFLSGEFWHEVLPAKKRRMSITGWFRER